MSVISKVGSSIADFFSSLFGAASRFLGSFFQAELNIVNNLHRISDSAKELTANIEHEIETIKHFHFDPKWKSRVISIPKAIDQTTELVQKVVDAFKGKLQKLLDPIHELSLIFKQEAQPDAGVDQPSKLAKTAVKIDEVATMISQIADAMDVIKEMESVFEEVTNQLQTLDVLFLQNRNPQKKASKVGRFRVGKLNGS